MQSRRPILFTLGIAAALSSSLASCAGVRDAALTGGAPTQLDGWLLRPEGPGPFPAVLALHGCAGLYGSNGELTPRHRDWAERWVSQGYAVLFADSFTPRGADEICSRDQRSIRTGYERNRDVYGALEYLESLPFIRADRIALVGWSNGAMTVLAAVAAQTQARPAALPYLPAVAIAFYPGCKPSLERREWMPPAVPLHILIGERDDWTPASECIELAAQARSAGAPFDLIVYPGAFHDFDDPAMKLHVRHHVSTTASGTATIGTDPAARADSLDRVAAILRKALQ